MEGKPAENAEGEGFLLLLTQISVSLGGAFRIDENNMSARKLVRSSAVG